MRRPLPGNVTGELVRVALMEARPAGLRLPQLIAATDLFGVHSSTANAGLTTPKTAGRTTWLPAKPPNSARFATGTPPVDWIGYERELLRTLLTRSSRLLSGTIDPHAARLPDDAWVHLVLAQLNGVRAALVMLTTDTTRIPAR